MTREERLDFIREMSSQGKTCKAIAKDLGITMQRVHQIQRHHDMPSNQSRRKRALEGKSLETKWLDRMLSNKGVPMGDRLDLLADTVLPGVCPVFGMPLEYNGPKGKHNENKWRTRSDSSASIDRIDSSKGYVKGNVQIISWRANRIKNDSTPEELRKLADYMEAKQGESV